MQPRSGLAIVHDLQSGITLITAVKPLHDTKAVIP